MTRRVHMGVATSTFYDIAEDVIEAIIETFPIKFDLSQGALKARAVEFAQGHRPHIRVFQGVVGAVDCLLIKIRCPWSSEVGMPRAFYSRKGFFSINVQGVCDAPREHARCTWVWYVYSVGVNSVSTWVLYHRRHCLPWYPADFDTIHW